MRVAVLLTGIDDLFSLIKSRIYEQFKTDGVEFDFFACIWNEKIASISNNTDVDIHKRFYESLTKKNDPLLYIDDNIKNYKVISYNIILKNYAKLPKIKDHIKKNKVVSFTSYVSQSVAISNAFSCLEKYVETTGTKYDVVLKWRYDLLIDSKPSTFSKICTSVKNGILYCPLVDENQMSDYYYYADYETFKRAISNVEIKMAHKMTGAILRLEKLNQRGMDINIHDPYVMYHERMLMECFHENLGKNGVQKNNISLPRTTIFREGADPTSSFNDILEYNKTQWSNQGWEIRILGLNVP